MEFLFLTINIINYFFYFAFNTLSLDQRLYWCDAGSDRIETVDFNGTNRKNLFEGYTFDTNAYDLAISGNDIYWTDWLYYNLVRMDKYAVIVSVEPATPPLLEQGGGIHKGVLYRI